MIQLTEKDGSLIFSVRVVSRASRSEIVGELDGTLKIKLVSPPIEGAANEELIKFLSKKFNVPKNAVAILNGQTSKQKRIQINGINREDFLNLINV